MIQFIGKNMVDAIKYDAALEKRETREKAVKHFHSQPLSNIRKVIAKAMHASLTEMAQLTHTFSFDATQILDLRKWVKENGKAEGLENITLNDMLLYAVSRTILSCPELNAHFLENKMELFEDVNLGIAVDTPRGLLVPTVFQANRLSLNELSAETKKLVQQAQTGTIDLECLHGASFTVSNLGFFGVEHFTPVINPPQTGILGVNTIQTRIKVADGEMMPYPAMGLSITYDHRAIDGAPVSKYMNGLCTYMEHFAEHFSR